MLKQRILTALVLLPLMLLMLLAAGSALWAAFVALITLLALWEYARICAFTAKQQLVYVAGTALFMLTAYVGDWMLPAFVWLAVLLFWLAAVPLWLHKKWALRGAGVRTAAVGWLVLLPFWYALLMLRPQGGGVAELLAVMALVWLADVAAYFCGRKWGRHKLAPAISPGKSWEGVAGALAAVVPYVAVVYGCGWFGSGLSWGGAMMLALLLTALSVAGDLFESWLKRTAGVKDSGNLLPGHGGVLDRIDGLAAVLAVYAAFSVWFN